MITEESLLEEVSARILQLQKAHVSLEEQSKEINNTYERKINDTALKLIDILDLIDTIKASAVSNNIVNAATELVVIKKIERRLIEVLKSLQIVEIIFKDNKIDTENARVIETIQNPNLEPGTIVSICRKGYRTENRVIRSADVITVSGLS